MSCSLHASLLSARRVGIGVVLTLIAAALVACTEDEDRAETSKTTTVSARADLGTTGPLTWEAAGRTTKADEGDHVELTTNRDAAAMLSVLDEKHRRRGLGISVDVDGLTGASVTVDFRSTAVTELLLSPRYLTTNPVAVLAIQHAAYASPHLAGLAAQLQSHAEKDPSYLEHPTRAEMAGLALVAKDVDATLARTTARLKAAVRSTGSATTTLDHGTGTVRRAVAPAVATPRCSVMLPYRPVKTGVCYTAPNGTKGTGDVTLHANSGSPSWALLFSSGRPDLPLGLVPAAVYTQPGVGDLVDALVVSLERLGRQAWCQTVVDTLSRHCDTKVWEKWLEVTDPPKEGSADLHIPGRLTGSPTYAIEAGGAGAGDTTKVPVGTTDVEVWRNVTVALTLWSQFVSPLKALVDGVRVESLERAPKADSAKWKALATAVSGPIRSELTQFTNDLVGGSSDAVWSDAVKVANDMLEDPGVAKAFLGLWDLNAEDLEIQAIERQMEKYSGPVKGRWKLYLELVKAEGPGTSAGVGLYRLDVEVGSYPTFASFRPLRPELAPTPSPPHVGGDLPPVPAPGAGHWANHAFTLTIDSSGGVVINWRIGMWCEYTKQRPCDERKGHEVIPGGEAEGQLEHGSGNGTITLTTDSSLVATGPVAIERKGTSIARLLVTRRNGPPDDLVKHQGAGPFYPVG